MTTPTPRIPRIAVVLAAVALMALAGCGADKIDAKPKPTSAPAATAAAEPTATVAQWASIIAEHGTAVTDALADANSQCPSVAYDDTNGICMAEWSSVALNVDTLSITFLGAQGPASKTYLGDPPAEIGDLVKSTSDAVQAAENASTTFQACTATCLEPVLILDLQAGTLVDKLNGWQPYV